MSLRAGLYSAGFAVVAEPDIGLAANLKLNIPDSFFEEKDGG